MFDENSRYNKTETYETKDKRNRLVQVVAVPEAPRQTLLGFHVHKEAQRLDHLAGRYLNNPAGFWRIAEFNDAMLAEALSEVQEIAIPNKR